MKTSFFKRAIATVSVVPIALAQCLSVANAVDTNDTADGKVITLDTGNADALLYIAPDEAGLEYVRDETAKEFTKISNWGSEVQNLIATIANSNSKTGTLDASKAYEQAIAKSGQYADVTAKLIEKISDITYTVSEDKIVINASLADITPIYTEAAQNTVGGALQKLADEYGIPELADTDSIFGGVVIGGDIEITINTSDLENYNVSGEVKFTDLATGEEYTGTSVIDWALESFDTLKANAKEQCDKYGDIVDTDAAYKQIDSSMKFYVDKLNASKRYIDRALNANRSGNWDDVTPIINWVSNQVAKRTGKNIQSTTASQLVSTDIFQKAYDAAFEQINTLAGDNYTIQISPDELGVLGDSLYEIAGSTSNGIATFSAKFPDQEAAAAEAYLEATYDVDITEIYKEVEVTVDFTNIKTSGASANVIVKRVAKYEDVVTTTTTTSTTTSTTTETTTTTETETSTTTTTTDANTPTDTTTTTTDTDTPGTDTTTTTTVSTDTDVPGTDTTTTTGSTDTDIPGTDTTTRTERKYVTNFYTETTVGFYLDIDPEFNIDQLDSISYAIDYSLLTYGEGDVLLSQEVILAGEKADIKELVEFKDVPADTLNRDLDNDVVQFATQVPVYAKEDIIASNGTIIVNAGEILKNVDGSNVSATAYVGVKGDADLDLKADSADSSAVLVYYAKLQTGSTAAETQFSTNTKLVQADPMLDEFAAFLADVDNENTVGNFTALKPARNMSSADASFILTYFAEVQTGKAAGRATWNEVLGEQYAKN